MKFPDVVELGEEVAEFLKRLIAIPSINPEIPGANHTLIGEEKICKFLQEEFTKLGAYTQIEELGKTNGVKRQNLIAKFYRKDSVRKKPRLLLAPHTDTIIAEKVLLQSRQEDGKIYGRGACDTKGSIACMWAACKYWTKMPADQKYCELAFVGLAGEEFGQIGSRDFATKAVEEFDYAIIGEPTSCDAVIKHKAHYALRLVSRGIAGHGSHPHDENNAILKICSAIEAIRNLVNETWAKKHIDEFLGVPTVNIGVISGGKQPNVVPDYCEVQMDLRATPTLSEAEIFTDLHKILAKLGKNYFELARLNKAAPALNTNANSYFVQLLKKLGIKLVGASWFCDAAIFAQAGLPSVAIGPGSIEQAHAEDEYVKVEQLGKCARLYLDIFCALK